MKPLNFIATRINKDFAPHPQYEGPIICCDVTPIAERDTPYGRRKQLRFVFNSGIHRDNGQPFYVWTRWFTPFLGERATLRAFLRDWLGADLTREEQQAFDLERMVGKTAHGVITQRQRGSGDTYAIIASIGPDTSGSNIAVSSDYIRVKDRITNPSL